jgi:hypothetical protein
MLKMYFTDEERKAAHRKQAYDSFIRRKKPRAAAKAKREKELAKSFKAFAKDEKITPKNKAIRLGAFKRKVIVYWNKTKDYFLQQEINVCGEWKVKDKELTEKSDIICHENAKKAFLETLDKNDFLDDLTEGYYIRHFDTLIKSISIRNLEF